MHVELAEQAKAASAHSDWEEWSLGDLLAGLAGAVELVGPGARVTRASVRSRSGGLPLVTVYVEDEAVAEGIWDAAVENEYDVLELGQDGGGGWLAEANGILLRVVVTEGGAR